MVSDENGIDSKNTTINVLNGDSSGGSNSGGSRSGSEIDSKKSMSAPGLELFMG